MPFLFLFLAAVDSFGRAAVAIAGRIAFACALLLLVQSDHTTLTNSDAAIRIFQTLSPAMEIDSNTEACCMREGKATENKEKRKTRKRGALGG
jgi:hypothetical protein